MPKLNLMNPSGGSNQANKVYISNNNLNYSAVKSVAPIFSMSSIYRAKTTSCGACGK